MLASAHRRQTQQPRQTNRCVRRAAQLISETTEAQSGLRGGGEALGVECVSLVMKSVGEVTLLESLTASWGQRGDQLARTSPKYNASSSGKPGHFTAPRAPAMPDGRKLVP